MKNVCLLGATGKMGSTIQEVLGGAVVVIGFSKITDVDAFNSAVFQSDVVIDFSHADNIQFALRACLANNKPYFCGTTNLNADNFKAFADAVGNIAVMYASNTSFGVAVLKKAVQLVAREFGTTADIEISETHHRAKKDAPSGTALGLGKVVADALGQSLDQLQVTDRVNIPRGNNPQIGFTSLRGGSVIGEHTVHFFSNNEIIRLSHECLDRKVFAEGAVKAAMWLCKQPKGFYSMEDMLGK